MSARLIFLIVLSVPAVTPQFSFSKPAFVAPAKTTATSPGAKKSKSSTFSSIDTQDVKSNSFDLSESVSLIASEDNSGTFTLDSCKSQCLQEDLCAVAVHCEAEAGAPCIPPACMRFTIRGMGHCYMYQMSSAGAAASSIQDTDTCNFMVYHPNCRSSAPTLANANSNLRVFKTGGLVEVKYACRPGHIVKTFGSAVATCDKNGVWIEPTVVCDSERTSNTGPSSGGLGQGPMFNKKTR
ncbi:uncharacterized protein LOC124287381 [Haliotis rubra]|uniref:uncharacterized protein LOC124287381 n=1 Tax=Haliotis rubra TaxID=36100 RepID=UPI001EE58D75|nr:uncharacterized protein LOC124287381 [Haliotis rubra]